MSIGQGENAQTVINMARFYVALANDGVMLRPTIAKLPSPRSISKRCRSGLSRTCGPGGVVMNLA